MRSGSFNDHTLGIFWIQNRVAFRNVNSLADIICAFAGAVSRIGNIWSLNDIVRDELAPEWAHHRARLVDRYFSVVAVCRGEEQRECALVGQRHVVSRAG